MVIYEYYLKTNTKHWKFVNLVLFQIQMCVGMCTGIWFVYDTRRYARNCIVVSISHFLYLDVTTIIKGRDLTQSYDKSPIHPQTNPKRNVRTQKRHQNFDNTTIADWLRTISWGNDSHPTGVVKPVDGIPILPLTTTGV